MTDTTPAEIIEANYHLIHGYAGPLGGHYGESVEKALARDGYIIVPAAEFEKLKADATGKYAGC